MDILSHLCVVKSWTHTCKLADIKLSYIGQECYRIPAILGLTYGSQVKRLDLSYNSIRTLDGLQLFPNVEELILDNNDLYDGVEFFYNPNLTTLSLNKNKFQDLDGLLDSINQYYPNLTYLSFLGNPACPDQLSSNDKDDDDYQRYRYYTLYKLPKLKFLDSTSVKNYERKEANRIGQFMKVIKPKENSLEMSDDDDTIDALFYNPLPPSQPKEGTHRGMFGIVKHHYTGKNSEGNRFIRNHEL
ncbi:leucine-rich melanocyte differentiation-associated protein-like isoform X2 [Centruroides vittatus]|uniref:leucine-rich melanocyte differentiation-associated protein-like isoform X2 n=1 Tax=Centruroides vittatus TaxID=120091 RepID=UPI00350E9551